MATLSRDLQRRPKRGSRCRLRPGLGMRLSTSTILPDSLQLAIRKTLDSCQAPILPILSVYTFDFHRSTDDTSST